MWVPGAFEIPLIAQNGRERQIRCNHHLGNSFAGPPRIMIMYATSGQGVSAINLKTGVPTIFGVVTTENIEQAVERAERRPAIKAGIRYGALKWRT